MSNTCAAACCVQQVIQTRKSDANLQQRQDLLSRFMCLRDEKCVATRCRCSFAATDPQVLPCAPVGAVSVATHHQRRTFATRS